MDAYGARELGEALAVSPGLDSLDVRSNDFWSYSISGKRALADALATNCALTDLRGPDGHLCEPVVARNRALWAHGRLHPPCPTWRMRPASAS